MPNKIAPTLDRAVRICDYSPNGSRCLHGCDDDDCLIFSQKIEKQTGKRTVTVPKGYVVVPEQPTYEMIYRAHQAWEGRYGKGTDQTNEDIWKAMVQAAPKID